MALPEIAAGEDFVLRNFRIWLIGDESAALVFLTIVVWDTFEGDNDWLEFPAVGLDSSRASSARPRSRLN